MSAMGTFSSVLIRFIASIQQIASLASVTVTRSQAELHPHVAVLKGKKVTRFEKRDLPNRRDCTQRVSISRST